MPARYLVTHPCQDACGTLQTDDVVEGAPVYLCPGCDTSWIELTEPAPDIPVSAPAVPMT